MSLPDMEDHLYVVTFLTAMSAADQANPHLLSALKTEFQDFRFINETLLICRRKHPVPEGAGVVQFGAVMDSAGLQDKQWTAALVAHLEYCLGEDNLKMAAFQESSGGDGYDETNGASSDQFS